MPLLALSWATGSDDSICPTATTHSSGTNSMAAAGGVVSRDWDGLLQQQWRVWALFVPTARQSLQLQLRSVRLCSGSQDAALGQLRLGFGAL